jgi:hypothetical protein
MSVTTEHTKPVLTRDEMKGIADRVIADLEGYRVDTQYAQDLGRDDLYVVRHPTSGTLWIDLVLDPYGVPKLEATWGPGDGMQPVFGYIDFAILHYYEKRLNDQMKTHAGRHVFRQSGDSWYVAFGNEAQLIPHTLGMVYIHELLAHPATEFPALELYQTFNPLASDEVIEVTGVTLSAEEMEEMGMHIDTGRNDDPKIDAGTWAFLKRHMDGLKQQRAQAIEDKNAELANQLAAEIAKDDEAIRKYRKETTRPGGESRREIDNQERARNSVRKAINDALDHMDTVPGLQDHLHKSIQRRDRVVYVVGSIQWNT